MSDHVTAVYELESAVPLERAAEVIAGEQSCGTFVRVARESDELRARHAAHVVKIEELPLSGRPPLPGMVGDPNQLRRGRVTIEFPLANFGPSIPNLLAAVAGNLFELREVGALRLVDLELPSAFADRYPGPRFGIDGTRSLMDRPDGPMIGTIVKPSIGLTGDQLAQLVTELGDAGIDFIKDDELQGNPPGLPLLERIRVVTDALKKVADRNGRMPMYAFNITDDIDRLEPNHDAVLAAGGTCVMVCVNMVGLAGLEYLSRRTQLPIHGHRAMYGAYARSPQLGIDYTPWQQLARLSGADHLHTNGFANKFYETDDEVLASVSAVRAPLLGGYETLPVLSSAQTPGLAHLTYERTQTTDLLVLSGGGIHGHPQGSAAGVLAMREAWDAATSGEPLDERAAKVPALAAALDTFGRPT
ncbi:ribulose-bisphosphate carboxylase large chain [Kribbella aluminosa]|uniref:Ribulose-bisphosphate carboxylase large chain n=1 Tax=Kribbella aluminosa TaxID=416017 RepID=A0ABS4UTQ5_9ACTN|nr:RuBisCO large subunit C-terminal-like domain-containing protein [Kribbella aluminosa]MBP2355030.1 ribulose-bisphosphate carboxylase large chain [Kribbella aluminosa]